MKSYSKEKYKNYRSIAKILVQPELMKYRVFLKSEPFLTNIFSTTDDPNSLKIFIEVTFWYYQQLCGISKTSVQKCLSIIKFKITCKNAILLSKENSLFFSPGSVWPLFFSMTKGNHFFKLNRYTLCISAAGISSHDIIILSFNACLVNLSLTPL